MSAAREPDARAGNRPAGRSTTHPGRLAREADRVIDRRHIQSVFQPLVHIATNEVVGYEALTRGPPGSALEHPVDLLMAAREAGRLAELDWLCAAKACEAALAARLHPSSTVFLNFEPATLLTPCPQDLAGSTRRAQDRLRVVVEMKEDSLIADPARTFDALMHVRATGWGVALDAAAATPASLALLPLVHPDVLKLDLRGLSGDLLRIAEMSDGARLYAEQTGATLLAQGLEDPDDLLLAQAAGAAFGQGWYFGHPGPLPDGGPVPRSVFPLLAPPELEVAATPFEIVSGRQPGAVTEKRFLLPIAQYLEQQTDANGPPALLLLSYAIGTAATARSLDQLESLAERSAFTMVLGDGLATATSPKCRTQSAHPRDPICKEWIVAVLGPHYAGALVARDLDDVAPDARRRFAYAITHDRELILAAARGFLRRFSARPAAIAL